MKLLQTSCRRLMCSAVANGARYYLAIGVCVAVLPTQSSAQSAAVPVKAIGWSEHQDLLSEDLAVHWTQFCSANGPKTQTVWKRVEDGDPKMTRLVCSGVPRGFL